MIPYIANRSRATRRRRIFSLVCAGLISTVTTPVLAAGAAELSVDRATVRHWLTEALSEPIQVELPVGTIELRLSPPKEVRFVDGGIEARLAMEPTRALGSAELSVRYETHLDRRTGTLRFLPTTARLQPEPPLLGDLSRWMPPMALPRRLSGEFELGEGRVVALTAFVHRVRIDEERLRLELGLDLR